MALIKCPECGREISDRAVACPGCGFPVAEIPPDERSETDKLADELFEKYPVDRVKGTKEFKDAAGCDLVTAKDIMAIRYNSDKGKQLMAEYKQQKKAEKKEKRRQESEERAAYFAAIDVYQSASGKNVVKCPKCGSTSIQYTTKKLSLGRSLVGDAVAGPVGAVLGGLSSSKGYAVCMNCGKKWKV